MVKQEDARWSCADPLSHGPAGSRLLAHAVGTHIFLADSRPVSTAETSRPRREDIQSVRRRPALAGPRAHRLWPAAVLSTRTGCGMRFRVKEPPSPGRSEARGVQPV